MRRGSWGRGEAPLSRQSLVYQDRNPKRTYEPMTDFSPLEGALKVRCGPLAPVGWVVRGASVVGSTEEPRVNMKAPDAICDVDYPRQRTFLAPRLLGSSDFADQHAL